MKNYGKLFYLTSIVITCLMLQGCIVAAVGAGVGAVKWANAKKLEAQMKCNEAYNNYLSLMLKNHKTPMDLNEYCKNNN